MQKSPRGHFPYPIELQKVVLKFFGSNPELAAASISPLLLRIKRISLPCANNTLYMATRQKLKKGSKCKFPGAEREGHLLSLEDGSLQYVRNRCGTEVAQFV